MRGDQINPIANFCDRRITEIIEDQILKLGTISSSLRTMWFFCYLLFEEYLVYSKEGKTRSQNLIDENVLRRTLLSFFSNYVLSSEINRLYKNDFYVDNSSKSLLTLSNMSPSEYKKIDRKILEILKDKKDDYSQTKIFLCYAQVDEERAKLIYLKLAESGYTPWMHCFNVLPGLDWREQRTLAVREAKNFLVILSKNSYTQEGFFLKEIRDALDIWQTKLRNIPYLIPVRLEKCKIPYDLTNFLHVDIFEDSGWDKLLMAIDIGIKRRKNDPRRKKAN
ncbi:MAG TPA: hypothetical protein DDY18_01015 [Flavobacterium sp.]|nr:hypothetical protein [Flavobacterium sp.]